MVNNSRHADRVRLMARKKSSDDVWNEIFDNLILDNEPPLEYIKNVVITTKTGLRLRVSAIDFAQILERERFLTPEESDILSCRLAINFDKLRKDVDEWANDVIAFFENTDRVSKRKQASASKTKTTRKTAKRASKKDAPEAKAKTKAKKSGDQAKR